MAAHRWDTEPAQILPSRLAVRRRRERQATGLPEAASGGLDGPHPRSPKPLGTRLDGTASDQVPPCSSTEGAAEHLQDEPAERRAVHPRRWRFPLRAAALFACLLLAAAVAIPLLRIRAPHESIAVDLGADVNTAVGSTAADAELSRSSAEKPGPDQSGTNLAPDQGSNPGAASPDSMPGSSRQGPEHGTATGPELVVHVAGAVAAPGIVRIKTGGRVADAVGAAGGALPEADLTLVNLAAPMEDGSMVVVPVVGAAVPGPAGVSGAVVPAGPAGQGSLSGLGSTGGHPAGSGAGSGAGKAAAGPVNLNTATDAELQTLPRVGPVLAARIVAWRTEHGRFTRPEDLDAVPGIGEAMLAALVPLVTV